MADSALPRIHPVTTGRVSHLVVEQFEALLESGELGVGDRLPPERVLAEMFGVGRNSVREALRELEIRGLVERRRGQGTHVRRLDVQEMMAPLRSVINLSATGIDDVLQFRRVFEPGVAALAAERADEDGIELLSAAFDCYDEALDEEPGTGTARRAEADARFHRALAQATGNPIIVALHDALDELMADFRGKLAESSYVPGRDVARGHKPIFDAIVAGEPRRAREATLRHLAAVAGDLDAPPPPAPAPAPARAGTLHQDHL